MKARLLSEAIPVLAQELEELLAKEGETDLKAQVPSLRIIERCRCGDDGCAHIYTAPKPNGAYGPGHTNVVLNPTHGYIVLDVVGREIVAVEVLDRREIREALLAVLP